MPELGRFGNTFAHLAEKYPLFGIVESLSALDGQGARRPLVSLYVDGIKKMAGGTGERADAACTEKGKEGEATAATFRQAVPWRHG